MPQTEGAATPLKVHAVDDMLFYFDYALRAHRWDGVCGSEIAIA